jgi:hypothetical protein
VAERLTFTLWQRSKVENLCLLDMYKVTASRMDEQHKEIHQEITIWTLVLEDLV